MSAGRLLLTCCWLVLAAGCHAYDDVSDLVIGRPGIDYIYDVVGPTPEDRTTVRLRSTSTSTGFKVIEEEVERGEESPKKAFPLGRVEYEIRIDSKTGKAVQILAGSERTLLRPPLAKDSGQWTSTTTLATLGEPRSAQETCEISSALMQSEKHKTRVVTTMCVADFDDNRLIATTEFAEAVGMRKRVVELVRGDEKSVVLTMTLRGPS